MSAKTKFLLLGLGSRDPVTVRVRVPVTVRVWVRVNVRVLANVRVSLSVVLVTIRRILLLSMLFSC